ncbi:MAG: dihydropteroate synthase [Deltaproteobacteria bacterium]|jgi:dihydropteroate synthase
MLTLKWKNGQCLDLDARTHIMGILNVTPDSFSDGGRYFDTQKAIEHGFRMAEEGADIIDVGGESTRPYAKKLSTDEEIARVLPVIEALSGALSIPISIDTYKARVAHEALDAGAAIINDVSALRFDPEMASVAAEAGVPVILMHMKGVPQDMQDQPHYDNLILEVMNFLQDALDRAAAAGIRREMTVVDPGIGFGKTFDHNLKILRELAQFQTLERPILLGCSNKAFIGHILKKEPHERVTGSMAAAAVGAMNGANILRVHHVKKAVETVKIVDAIKAGETPE